MSFQGHSLKCYSCRGSIGKCSLPQNRKAVTCKKRQTCSKLVMYDKRKTRLGNKIYLNFICSGARKEKKKNLFHVQRTLQHVGNMLSLR